jgi:hypothetical protein
MGRIGIEQVQQGNYCPLAMTPGSRPPGGNLGVNLKIFLEGRSSRPGGQSWKKPSQLANVLASRSPVRRSLAQDCIFGAPSGNDTSWAFWDLSVSQFLKTAIPIGNVSECVLVWCLFEKRIHWASSDGARRFHRHGTHLSGLALRHVTWICDLIRAEPAHVQCVKK